MLMQAQQIAIVARERARKDNWPLDLLNAVNMALENADPKGLDWLAGAGENWAGVIEALANVQQARPQDAQRLQPLIEIANVGAGIRAGLIDTTVDAAEDFGRAVAQDLRDFGAGAADIPRKALDLMPYLLGAAAIGFGWYYLGGPKRGTR